MQVGSLIIHNFIIHTIVSVAMTEVMSISIHKPSKGGIHKGLTYPVSLIERSEALLVDHWSC